MRTLLAMLILSASGCGIRFRHQPPGTVAGRYAVYDYSPTAVQTGNVRQLWWCGWDDNASDRSQISDSIEYESIDLATGAHSPPKPVFAETQYAWDGAYTCNPKVIRGSFVNPLGNGETYTYALYYVATGAVVDVPNKIGVAFSNNGTDWKKYPQPIIFPVGQIGYGVGQPAVHNDDHKSAIRMFYEDWENAPVYHVETISQDGVHFHVLGRLTTKGLDPNNPSPSWGDMDYDPVTGYWYAAFNLQNRPPASTGGVQELGQYGIQVYRIPDASLLTGATPWELVMTIDTCMTGFESNFLPGFVRDRYGNLNVGSYPALQLYTSISNPPPAWNATPYEAQFSATIGRWDISLVTVEPVPPKALNRYFNQTVHEVTTGWIDPNGGFSLEKTLGHLYENPQSGATLQFFSCKAGSTAYFVSLDYTCGGALVLGSEGYGYSKPVAGLNLVTLYSCSNGTDDFVSNDAACEGKAAGPLLGYALP